MMGFVIKPPPAQHGPVSITQLTAMRTREETRAARLGKYGFMFLGASMVCGLAAGILSGVSPLFMAVALVVTVGSAAGTAACHIKQRASLREIRKLAKSIAAQAAAVPAEEPAPAPVAPSLTPSFEAAIAQEMTDGAANQIQVRGPLQLTKRPGNAA